MCNGGLRTNADMPGWCVDAVTLYETEHGLASGAADNLLSTYMRSSSRPKTNPLRWARCCADLAKRHALTESATSAAVSNLLQALYLATVCNPTGCVLVLGPNTRLVNKKGLWRSEVPSRLPQNGADMVYATVSFCPCVTPRLALVNLWFRFCAFES